MHLFQYDYSKYLNCVTLEISRTTLVEISRTTLVIFVKDVFLINIKRNTGVGGGVIYSIFLCCSSCI